MGGYHHLAVSVIFIFFNMVLQSGYWHGMCLPMLMGYTFCAASNIVPIDTASQSVLSWSHASSICSHFAACYLLSGLLVVKFVYIVWQFQRLLKICAVRLPNGCKSMACTPQVTAVWSDNTVSKHMLGHHCTVYFLKMHKSVRWRYCYEIGRTKHVIANVHI